MSNPTGLDKRKFARLDTALDVAVNIESAGGTMTGLPEKLHATCRNLSLHGLCLETSCLANGAVRLLAGRPGEREYTLSLEIIMQPQDPPLQVSGEVCWYNVDHAALNFIYQVGVEFSELTPQARTALKGFIKAHSQSRSIFQAIRDFFSGN